VGVWSRLDRQKPDIRHWKKRGEFKVPLEECAFKISTSTNLSCQKITVFRPDHAILEEVPGGGTLKRKQRPEKITKPKHIVTNRWNRTFARPVPRRQKGKDSDRM